MRQRIPLRHTPIPPEQIQRQSLRHVSIAAGAGLATLLLLAGGCSKDTPTPSAPPTPPANATASADGEARAAAANEPDKEAGAASGQPEGLDQVAAPSPGGRAEGAPQDQAAEPGKPSLVLWHAYSGREKSAIEAVVKAWDDETPELAVIVKAIDYAEMADRIAVDVPAGVGPDLWIFAHNYGPKWRAFEIAEPFAQQVSADNLGDVVPLTMTAAVDRGAIVGFPFAAAPLVLYRSTDLAPDAPAGWDDLIAKAKALTEPESGRFGLAWDVRSLYFHSPWLSAAGASIFGATGDVQINNAANVAAASAVKALVDAHVVPSEAAGDTPGKLLAKGKAAFVISGPWLRAELPSGGGFGISKLPDSATGPVRGFMSVDLVYVSTKSARKPKAFELAAYLVGEESARRRALEGGQCVTHRRVLALPEVAQHVELGPLANAVERSEPIPVLPAMEWVWTPYDSALAQIMTGEVLPKQALDDARSAVMAELSRRNEVP